MKNLYTGLVLVGHLLEATVAKTTASFYCEQGSDVTTFPACNSFLNSNEACATVPDRPGKEDCYCHQEWLDSLQGCKNELRLCYLRNDFDNTFESALGLWNSLCSSVITFSPTTAKPSSYEPFAEEVCVEIKKACATAKTLLAECFPYNSDTDTSRFSSCTCRPTLLREHYSCHYLANTTCHGREATLSNLYGYSLCDNFDSVIGTGLPGASPATQTEIPTLDVSTTAMVGSATESTATATSTSDNASKKKNPRFGVVLMSTLYSLVWIFVI